MQQVAAGDVKGLQVAGTLPRTLKVQAQLAARDQAEPPQAQRGRQRDADAVSSNHERCQMLQLLACAPQLPVKGSLNAVRQAPTWYVERTFAWPVTACGHL